MNRRLLTLVAILVALPLFAFPVVSLPSDPGPQHVTWVHGIGDGDTVDEERLNVEIFGYEELTEDERAFFDAAVESDSRVETPVEDVPGRFEMIVPEDGDRPLVRQDGYYYRVSGHVTDPGPPMSEILPRVLSLVAAAALLSLGGYLYVNTDE